jgi:hypothetical protein
MGVVRRIAERRVDARLDLFRKRVLEPVGLGVNGIDLESECLGEVLLQQPVVPDHLDRDLPARGGEDRAAVALVADEAEGGEPLQHGRRR